MSPGVRFSPSRPNPAAIAPAPAPEPVAEAAPATTAYAVKSGDSLWTIAKKHKLTVAQLTAANGLSANAVLKPGQKLLIPSGGAAATAPATPAAAGKAGEPAAARPAAAGATAGAGFRHVVKSGETLGGIARTYGVKAGDLAVANNIADPAKIRPGMELVVPGWDSPAGKNGKAANGKAGATKSAAAPAAPAPAAPSTPPTINFDNPPPPPPGQPGTNPMIPIIRIDGDAPAPAPRTP
jgi:LysM repeat protein